MKVHIIQTGGTIVSVKDQESGISVDAAVEEDFLLHLIRSRLKSEEQAIKEPARSRDYLPPGDFQMSQNLITNVDSTHISPRHWESIHAEVKRVSLDDPNVDGFIILHGTNTLAYSAAALNFSLGHCEKPVLFTGSQIPINFAVSDGSNNLVGCVKVIRKLSTLRQASELPHIPTTLAVFGTRVIRGCRAKKISSRDPDGFRSFKLRRDCGTLGQELEIDLMDGAIPQKVSLEYGHLLTGEHGSFSGGVASITCHPAMESALYEKLLIVEHTPPLRGVVLRAFGEGDIPESLHPFLKACREQEIPVIATTQIATGVSSMDTNAPGKEAFRDFGVIRAWDMSIEAMTAKMMWLLGIGHLGYDQIRKLMETNIQGEILPYEQE